MGLFAGFVLAAVAAAASPGAVRRASDAQLAGRKTYAADLRQALELAPHDAPREKARKVLQLVGG